MPLPARPIGDPVSVPKYHSKWLEFQCMNSSKVIPCGRFAWIWSIFLDMSSHKTNDLKKTVEQNSCTSAIPNCDFDE